MSFFYPKESSIFSISALEVGTILTPWNLQGNESFKKEISCFPT
jgi:hypothetical protein